MINLVLNRKFNYRNILLTDSDTRQNVGYRRPNGDACFVRWLGFISREDAKALPGAYPVRLIDISRVGVQGAVHTQWQDVDSDHYVYGCLTKDGAYAIYNLDIVLIGPQKRESPHRDPV